MAAPLANILETKLRESEKSCSNKVTLEASFVRRLITSLVEHGAPYIRFPSHLIQVDHSTYATTNEISLECVKLIFGPRCFSLDLKDVLDWVDSPRESILDDSSVPPSRSGTLVIHCNVPLRRDQVDLVHSLCYDCLVSQIVFWGKVEDVLPSISSA